ncbi:MAG TPA: NTP transferase domain-containing protein [Acidimicrobiia bacterium]|nr:NTP transferase domain-containing protein [Acidimicrobiia bacterium]
MRTVLGIPLKGFDTAKGRLSGRLSADRRAALARATAERLLAAGRDAGFTVAIATPSEAVRRWAHRHGVDVLAEPPGGGLDGAAAAIAASGDPWCVVHGDLPLVTATDLTLVRQHLLDGRSVIAPSRDGGTNALGGSGAMRFSYGPGSFARHLSALADRSPVVMVTAGLTIELDTIGDLEGTARLPAGSWLDEYLG